MVLPPPPRGTSLFLQQHQAWPGHAGAREVGGGKRGGAEEEAEGGPEAAEANAAWGAWRRRLTSPPAAGKAESEGKWGARSEGWAPRGPADGALRRFCHR